MTLLDENGDGKDPRTLPIEALAGFESRIAKAIRAKCLDCCCGVQSEVARCHLTSCSLWPFRMGKSPWLSNARKDADNPPNFTKKGHEE